MTGVRNPIFISSYINYLSSVRGISLGFVSTGIKRWAIWLVSRRRAVPVVSVQRRQREETHSGISSNWTHLWIYSRSNTEVQIQYSTQWCHGYKDPE